MTASPTSQFPALVQTPTSTLMMPPASRQLSAATFPSPQLSPSNSPPPTLKPKATPRIRPAKPRTILQPRYLQPNSTPSQHRLTPTPPAIPMPPIPLPSSRNKRTPRPTPHTHPARPRTTPQHPYHRPSSTRSQCRLKPIPPAMPMHPTRLPNSRNKPIPRRTAKHQAHHKGKRRPTASKNSSLRSKASASNP